MRDSLEELGSETWKVIRKAAKEGDAEAQFLLGIRFHFGGFSARGCEKWLKAAGAQDHPEALRYLAQTEFRPELSWGTCPRTLKGRELLLRAAELGSVEAQRDLAVCFAWGDPPFEKDWSKVRFWYLKAAEQGHQEAQIAVGSMMIQGDGGPVNQAKGLSLIEAAADGRDLEESRAAARQWPSSTLELVECPRTPRKQPSGLPEQKGLKVAASAIHRNRIRIEAKYLSPTSCSVGRRVSKLPERE